MTEDDFKKIFSWVYGKAYSHDGFNYYIGGEPIGSSMSMILSMDGNRYVHQFEQKLIMNIKTDNKKYNVYIEAENIGEDWTSVYSIWNDKSYDVDYICKGAGKTRDEAVLNAILDYIDGNFIEKRMKLDSE